MSVQREPARLALVVLPSKDTGRDGILQGSQNSYGQFKTVFNPGRSSWALSQAAVSAKGTSASGKFQ